MSEASASSLMDAQLLFESFQTSSWRHLEVTSGPMRLLISRLTASERGTPSAPRNDAKGVESLIVAPHISTLRSVAELGSTIAAGDVYALIEVLDDAIELKAEQKITILEHARNPGDLLEFSSPLMRVFIGR